MQEKASVVKHYMRDYAPKDNARRQAHHQNGDY